MTTGDGAAQDEPPWLAEVRASYDIAAASYADLLADELDRLPIERSVLSSFAELVGVGQPVLDAGCGPGRLTGHLRNLGVDARGVDLSPAMVAEARRRHGDAHFAVADLRDLPHPDGGFAGVVAWYSLIHLPPAELTVAIAALHRVLAPGGLLLTAFQVGRDRRHIERAYGHELGLDAWRLDPDRIAGLMEASGFAVEVRTVRAPRSPEPSSQGFVLARRTTGPTDGGRDDR